MMKVTILHLSDSHFRSENDWIVGQAELIAASTYRYLHEADILLIVFSGDVAFSGRQQEYGVAKNFLEAIKKQVRSEKMVDVKFIVSPGNHDCDFESEGGVRSVLVDAIKTRGEDAINDDIISLCTSVQKSFDVFRKGLTTPDVKFDDPLLVQYKIILGSYEIVFSSINVAWMSEITDHQGQLVFPCNRYSKQFRESGDLHVIVMHHPINWYQQATYHRFRSMLRSTGHLILTGHEHTGSVFEIDDAREVDSAYVEAPALQPGNAGLSGFTIVNLDLERQQYQSIPFQWGKDCYEPTELTEPWGSYRKLPKKAVNTVDLTDEFLRELDDPGANYHHFQKGDLSLGDIFVFPDLEEAQVSEPDNRLVSSSTLETLSDETRILVTGDEQSGKTALLKVLFKRYHEAGFYPLLMRAEEIKHASVAELNKILERTITYQYSAERVGKWDSLQRAKKVLLLDDIDRTPVSDRYRGNVVSYFQERFGHVLMTAGSGQDIQELVSADASDLLRSFKYLSIRPFGYKLRHALIKRWHTLGNDQTVGTAELLGQIDDAEKVIDTVIGTNVVPRTPFYLLTLLQSLDDTTQADLRASAYGHYYQYLIVRALEREQFPADQLNELFNYCAQLAWFFHKAQSSEIAEVVSRIFRTLV